MHEEKEKQGKNNNMRNTMPINTCHSSGMDTIGRPTDRHAAEHGPPEKRVMCGIDLITH